MNLKPIIVSLSSLLIFSCGNKNDNTTEAAPDRVVFKPLDTIVSDEVITEFYERIDLSEEGLLSYTPSFTTHKNRHYKEITDTIYRFYKWRDTIAIFSNETNRFPVGAYLANSGSRVMGNIRIGSNKNELLEVLNVKDVSPEFYVTNTEGTNVLKMVIENNKLILVQYEGYID